MLDYFSHQKADTSDKYSLEDFIFRWKKLQRVLVKQGVDSLLLVTGLDSGDCVPSAYLFNWLFLGLSGKPVVINKYLDSVFSEIVLLISASDQNENFIFLPPDARAKLAPLIYVIPNCRVFCPTHKEYENKELMDIAKVAFFYEMVQKAKKIGVCLNENEDAKVIIEKWPLIQTYALEPVGKTFFTLQFQVSNLGTKISGLFKNLDKHSLKNLVSRTAYSLAGHVKGCTKILELTKSTARKDVTEFAIKESLQEAVDIYAVEAGVEGYHKHVNVLFGERTGKKDTPSSKEVSIRSSDALHATIEHFDPYTKMKVWRTFFLSTNLETHEQVHLKSWEDEETAIMKSKYVIEKSKNTSFENGSVLLGLYIGLVQGVLDSISTVTKDYKNLNKEFLTGSIFSKIKQVAEGIYQGSPIKQEHVEVELQSFDSFGEARPIDFKDSITFKLTSTFYVVKCRLNGILSVDKSKHLGSLVFSESFLLQEGCYLLLTKNVPYFDFCECREEEVSILENLNPNYELEPLGASLSSEGYKNHLFVPSEKLSSYHLFLPIENVKCYFHERGLRIFSEKFGWKMLFYDKLKNLTMINKISGEWVLMNIEQPMLFAGLESSTIAMQFHGKSFEFLMNKVNSKEKPLSITFLEVIPPVLSENWYFSEQILKKEAKEGALMHQHQILQNEFLWGFIEAKQLMIINQMKDIKFNAFKTIYLQKQSKQFQEGHRTENQHNLLLINGTYGCNKLKLAECLKRFGPVEFKTNIFNIPSENLHSKMEVKTFIEMIREHIENHSIPAKDDHALIVVVPSWLDCEELLNSLGEDFHVKCIVSTVNVSNFFSRNYDLTENVLTFAFPGYSQHIVVDTYGEDQEETNAVMKVVWNLNRQAKVYRTTNSMMTTGQCKDIIQQSTYTSDYQKFLRGKYGAFYHFDQLRKLQINYLEFKVPIYFLAEIKKLSQSEGFLTDLRATVGQELKGKREEAENSKDELMIGLFMIEESIILLKRKQKSMRVLSIKANLRVNGEQGISQLAWANRSYKEKVRPAEGIRSIGIFVVSKNFDELQIKKFLQGMSYKKVLDQNVQPLRTVQSLSEEERKAIEKEGRNKYLDGGEFFDGYFYRDVEGYILQHHPNLDKVLKEWVDGKNELINQDNQKIKGEWEAYLKEYQ